MAVARSSSQIVGCGGGEVGRKLRFLLRSWSPQKNEGRSNSSVPE
jgi:hypothetical protein